MVLLSHFSRIDRKYQTIAILVNNAFKTVQHSAKDKEECIAEKTEATETKATEKVRSADSYISH